MVSLKYVCLSDLHLGARYSLLTNYEDPLRASAPLGVFGKAFEMLLATLAPASPPTLLLLGDVLDMGLSPLSRTAMGFERFVEALFHTAGVLSPTVHYVPGNHDHAIWQAVKEQHTLAEIAKTPPKTPIALSSPVTRLFDPPTLENALLTELMRRTPHLARAHASVRVAYPNLGLRSGDGRRAVLFHHGHFIESVYRLMSELPRLVDPHAPLPATVEALESENATWIDFVWSTFGDTGVVGHDVGTLYTGLQDNAATDRFLARLSRQIAHRLLPYVPMHGEPAVRHYARLIAKVVLDLVVERRAELERNNWLTVLTPDSVAGLRWYLEEPLRRQIEAEQAGRLPDDVTFIFGHTHKPFEAELPLGAYRLPVKVFNTGGWVLDEPQMTAVEGATVVFVDDALNVVSLRLYDVPLNGVPVPARILPGGAYPPAAKDNPLLRALVGALIRTLPLWGAFADEVSIALEKRRQWLIQHFDHPGAPAAAGRR